MKKKEKREKKGKEKKRGPKTIPSPLNDPMLNYAEYYMSTVEKVLSFLVLFAAGGLVGWVFYGGLFKRDGAATLVTHISNGIVFGLVGLAAVKIFMPAVRNMLKNRRDKALRIQFRDLLETLATSLASGNTVMDAFANAREDLLNQYVEGDLIIRELEEIQTGIQNGQNLEVMLTAFGDRSGNEDIQNFSNVIANCFRIGGDFKNAVRKTRDVISEKMAIEEEIRTKVASNRLQHNAMCIMPICLVALMKAMSSSFAENLASPVGVLVTTVAIGIFVGSYFWGRKIIEIGG